jgi:hypothetical protein
MPVSPFIDGFPADAAHPDYAIHEIIDGELRNCHALEGTRALPRLLYPACFAAFGEWGAWLEPALRRFAWHEGKQPWHDHLRGLLRLVISPTDDPLSDEVLMLLARLGPQLQTNGGNDCQVIEQILAHLRTRKAPLLPEVTRALHQFVHHLIEVHCHGYSTFDVAWRLWRAPGNRDDGEPCFSALVRQDLRGMEPAEAQAWGAFLDLRPQDPSDTMIDAVAGWRPAIRQIGEKNFAVRWDGWIGWMYENQPAALSPAGRDLLLLFLHACRAVPTLPMDNALCQIAGVRWAAQGKLLLTKEWLGAMLVTLATRPAASAFACVERLSHNPNTCCFLQVRKLYNRLLAEVVSESVVPDQREGVDGYDLGSEPELYRQQVILDHCLRDTMPQPPPADLPGRPENVWNDDGMESLLVRRQALGDPLPFVRAVAHRSRWLKENTRPPEVLQRQETVFGAVEVRADDPYPAWRAALYDVQRLQLAAKPALGHDDLIAVLDGDLSAECGSPAAEVLAALKAHTKEHGYSLRLVETLKRWHAGFHGSHAALSVRRQIGWLLWLEDVASIDEKECWSQRIRKDLRAMPKESREAWRVLFENAAIAKSRKPSKRWERMAKAALAAMPAGELCRRVGEWFEPFHAGTPLRLTVPGRDALRNLMWLALPAQDAAVDEAIAWFASAKWRSKRDRSCAESLVPAFLFVMAERSPELAHRALETMHGNGTALWGKTHELYRELCVRLGRVPAVEARPAPQPPAAEELLPSMLKRFQSSKVRLEDDRLLVTGVRDSYVIHVADSRIVRQSDGASLRLEIDFSQTPWMQSMIDGMDMEHPFRPNYYRLMLCADVLVRDDENAASIVAEAEAAL